MATNKNFSPRTARESETLITQQSTLGQGLVAEVDSVNGGFKELNNAIDYGDRIEGRIGTSLYNCVDYEVEADSAETFQNSMPGGVEADELVMVKNFGDFSDGVLISSKTNLFDYLLFQDSPVFPMPFDVYKCTDNAAATGLYMGNLCFPYFEDFCPIKDAVTPQLFIVDIMGGVVTANASCPTFKEDLVGKYITLGMSGTYVDGNNYDFDGRRFLINRYIDETSFGINTRGYGVNGTFSMCYIQAPIWARIEFNEQIFILMGNDVFYSDKTFFSWNKVIKTHDLNFAQTYSKFHVIDNNLILSNLEGVYRFEIKNDIPQDTDALTTKKCNSVFVYQINSGFVNHRPQNKVVKIFGFSDSKSDMESETPYIPAGFSGDICYYDKTKPEENNSKTGGQIL